MSETGGGGVEKNQKYLKIKMKLWKTQGGVLNFSKRSEILLTLGPHPKKEKEKYLICLF